MAENINPYSVLIVGEDPAILVLVASMVERNGYRALLARTCGEALELCARQYVPLDVVVCDVLVGGRPGSVVVETLRQLRPSLREIYVSTATDSGAIRIRVMEKSGLDEFVPAAPTGLVDAVRMALNLSSRHAAAC